MCIHNHCVTQQRIWEYYNAPKTSQISKEGLQLKQHTHIDIQTTALACRQSSFQSVNMPSTDTNATLKIDLPDQTAILWATLALLQMNEMVPEDAVSEALGFREAIVLLLFSFPDAKAFLGLDSYACKHLKDQLDVLEFRAKQYCDYDYEWHPASVLFTTADYIPPSQTDQAQFAYLLEIPCPALRKAGVQDR